MAMESFGSRNVEAQQPEIREVKKMSDGSVNFPYSMENAGGRMIDHNFRIYKDKTGKFMIENKTKETPENKGYIKNIGQKFELRTSSSEDFLKDLGKALDAYIGPGRKSAPEKGLQAYKLLGFGKHLDAEIQKQQQEQEVMKKTKMESDELKNAVNFEWDGENKSLSYDYTIIDKNGDQTIKTKIKQDKTNIIVTLDAFKTRAAFDGGNENVDKKIVVDKKNIDALPDLITKSFQSGIEFTSYLGAKNTLKVSNSQLADKVHEKSEDAVRAFKFYSKEK